MKTIRQAALASALVLGLGATAQAQTYRPNQSENPATSPYDGATVTGRSVYADPIAAPGRSVEANGTVMGLRVPDAQRDR